MRAISLAFLVALAACDGPQTASVDTDTAQLAPTVQVDLVPQSGVTGTQVVNFAVPLPRGMATTSRVRVYKGTTELATYRRGLATYPDGSLRAIQIQVSLAVGTGAALTVNIGGTADGPARAAVAVSTTLKVADGTQGPKVWAVLPATWLAATGVAGRMVAQADIAGTPLDAWDEVCDYDQWGYAAFQAGMSNREAWLFDRPTALYRGYVMTGALSPLQSAYKEAAVYRAGITGTGTATRIGIPGASSDLKYHYTQGMALHYLLTGDDRFREAAENVAIRAHALWPDPGYAGGSDFWTERHAGFGLLAYEWAAIVSDDQAATFRGWGDVAADSYLATQTAFPSSWTDQTARCFAHTAEAHDEDYGYVGCSPWMSAILADGMIANLDRATTTRAAKLRTSLIQLGRIVARDGRDSTGKPYYWMGLGRAGEIDEYDEHWGESAYLVAVAWDLDGRRDAMLRTAADALVTGLRTRGETGQVRSFNWQCRSAVQTPAFLR